MLTESSAEWRSGPELRAGDPIRGGHSNVEAPVAVGARYEGLALAGAAKVFDRLLDSWLTRAIDMGMIGSGLGQLFPINLQRLHEAGKVKVGYLLLVGMGEPGRFAGDDLRFLMSNVTVAVKSMAHDQLVASLFGTRRNELPIGEAARNFISGILDGYERFRSIVDVVRDGQERLRQAAVNPLRVSLVEPDEEKLEKILVAFQTLGSENLDPGLKLSVVRGADVDPDPTSDSGAMDIEPDVPVTFLRVTRKVPALPALPLPPTAAVGMGLTETFGCSALSELSAVAVREEDISAYLLQALPDRMITSSSPEKRERLGVFFADLVIPETRGCEVSHSCRKARAFSIAKSTVNAANDSGRSNPASSGGKSPFRSIPKLVTSRARSSSSSGDGDGAAGSMSSIISSSIESRSLSSRKRGNVVR
jgi:hypothetical protein